MYGFGLGCLSVGFFSVILSGRARAARRRLSLGAARSGKGWAGHGGGRRGGREGSGPPVEVRAGRGGGTVSQGGRAGSAGGRGAAGTERSGGAAARDPAPPSPVPSLPRPNRAQRHLGTNAGLRPRGEAAVLLCGLNATSCLKKNTLTELL